MDRFWSKVEKTDTCWNWIAAKSGKGYGVFKLDGKLVSSHVLSYFWYYNINPKGFDVCHTCDNPSCVNPEHLFLGTRSDNMKDAQNKNRLNHLLTLPQVKGTQHGQAKLSETDVLTIKQRVEAGEKQNALAKEYGVSTSTIQNIYKSKKWKHILSVEEK